MNVKIIDYGMGNLFSVKTAFEKCGATVEIIDNPETLKEASHIILPGVGTFKDGMENLKAMRWDYYIKEAVNDYNIPLLGICLGMQLLASVGYEVGKTKGLDLISGEVKKLVSSKPKERIPHVGWNEIHKAKENNILLEGIENNLDFYFVHSYYFAATDESTVICKTPYCGEFTSIVAKDLVFGVQFHPEKSQSSGFKLIKNFLAI